MATSWPPKAPGDVLTYEVDWSADIGLDPITLVVVTATGVTVDRDEYTTATSTVVLSGGTSGTVATVTFAVTTASGYNDFSRDMSLLIADSVEALAPQTTTKRTIVEMAFEEIGLAGYSFDTAPEEYASALRRLDALMNEWRSPGIGINLGYNFPAAIGSSTLAEVSGIPDEAANTVVMSLALRIMPVIGKTMAPETRVALAQGMSALKATYAQRPERSLPRKTPRGAGYKPWGTWSPFMGDVT